MVAHMRLLLLVLLTGCPVVPPTPPIPPPTPQEEEACEAFCELITSLDCDGHEGSPGEDGIPGNEDDVPCPQVCRDFLVGDTYISDRSCLDSAQTCEAAEVCVFEGGQEPEQ